MIRAHVVKSGRLYQVKHAPCRVCGTPVEYVTCPRWYCTAHVPRHLQAHRQERALRLATHAESPVVVNAAPGFCVRCGVIRLSVVDKGGLCHECHHEVTTHHKR